MDNQTLAFYINYLRKDFDIPKGHEIYQVKTVQELLDLLADFPESDRKTDVMNHLSDKKPDSGFKETQEKSFLPDFSSLFVSNAKLHEQLISAIDSLTSGAELLASSTKEDDLKNQLATAEKDNDLGLIRSYQEQLSKLEYIKEFIDNPLAENVKNKQALDQDQAVSLIETMKKVSETLDTFKDTSISNSQLLETYSKSISDKTLTNEYRSQLVKEIIKIIPDLDNNTRTVIEPYLDNINTLVEKDVLTNTELNNLSTVINNIKTSHDASDSVNESVQEAKNIITSEGSIEGKIETIASLIEKLPNNAQFEEYSSELIQLQQTTNLTSDEYSDKATRILDALAADTTSSKTLYTLSNLSDKFDNATLSNEHLVTTLLNNNLENKLLDNPALVSTGQSVTSSLVSTALMTMGLGDVDAAFGLGDKITDGLGNLVKDKLGFGDGEIVTEMNDLEQSLNQLNDTIQSNGIGADSSADRQDQDNSKKKKRKNRRRRSKKGTSKFKSLFGKVKDKGLTTFSSGKASLLSKVSIPSLASGASALDILDNKNMFSGVSHIAEKVGLKGLAKGGAKFIPFLGQALALKDGFDGWNDAESISGLSKDKIDAGVKAQSALSSVLSGLSFGLVESQSVYKGLDSAMSWMEDLSHPDTKSESMLSSLTSNPAIGLLSGASAITAFSSLKQMLSSDIKEAPKLDMGTPEDLTLIDGKGELKESDIKTGAKHEESTTEKLLGTAVKGISTINIYPQGDLLTYDSLNGGIKRQTGFFSGFSNMFSNLFGSSKEEPVNNYPGPYRAAYTPLVNNSPEVEIKPEVKDVKNGEARDKDGKYIGEWVNGKFYEIGNIPAEETTEEDAMLSQLSSESSFNANIDETTSSVSNVEYSIPSMNSPSLSENQLAQVETEINRGILPVESGKSTQTPTKIKSSSSTAKPTQAIDHYGLKALNTIGLNV